MKGSHRLGDLMVMVMVAALTRPEAACLLCQGERCAEDGVDGGEGRGREGTKKETREEGGTWCVGSWF